MRIAIISPRFHPQTCGVGDNSMRLAEQLARDGAEVRVFSRGPAEPHPEAPTVHVIALAGCSPRAVARSAYRAVLEWRPDTVIIQYVPQMWGATRFGSLAVPLLCRALRRERARVVVFAHELKLSWAWRPDLAVGATFNWIQLAWLMRESDRFIVTTESRLRGTAVLARALHREGHVAFVPVGPGANPHRG